MQVMTTQEDRKINEKSKITPFGKHKNIMLARRKRKEQKEQEEKDRSIRKLEIMQKRLQQVKEWLASPQVVLEIFMTDIAKRKYHELTCKINYHQTVYDSINRSILFFGHPVISFLTLAFSMVLGFFWLYQNLGTDYIAGNEMLTMSIFAGLVMVLDIVAFYSISGGLMALNGFMKPRKYMRILEVIIFTGFVVGALTFVFNIVLRLMEVSI